MAGKKVRCPVCLEVVIAPHVAVPVEDESAVDKVLPAHEPPVVGEHPGGSPLEIPDNPAIAPLDAKKDDHLAESPPGPNLEIPDNPTKVPLRPEADDQPLLPEGTQATLPLAKPITGDAWDKDAPRATLPAVSVGGEKGPPPLPTGIQDFAGPPPGDAGTPPMAVPVFAQPFAITEGRPIAGEEDVDYVDDVEAVGRLAKISKRKEKRAQMRRVQLGLGFHFWKYLTYVLGINLTISGVILATFALFLGVLIVFVGYVAMLVSPVLGIVGSILCTWVPAKSEAKVLITVSLGLDASCLAIGFLGGFIGLMTQTLPGAHGVAFLVFLIAAIACGLGGFVMFMLFLRKFAYYLNDYKSGDEAMTHMINLLAVVLGGGTIMIVTATILFKIEVWLAGFALGIEYLTFFILFLKILFSILEVISTLRARIN